MREFLETIMLPLCVSCVPGANPRACALFIRPVYRAPALPPVGRWEKGAPVLPEERARTKPSAPFSGHCVRAHDKTLKVLEGTSQPSIALRHWQGQRFGAGETGDMPGDTSWERHRPILATLAARSLLPSTSTSARRRSSSADDHNLFARRCSCRPRLASRTCCGGSSGMP